MQDVNEVGGSGEAGSQLDLVGTQQCRDGDYLAREGCVRLLYSDPGQPHSPVGLGTHFTAGEIEA